MRMGRKCVANKDAHLRGGEQRTSFVERSQEAGLVSCLHYPARGGWHELFQRQEGLGGDLSAPCICIANGMNVVD